MDATGAFLEDVSQLCDMLDDWNLKPKDYYDKFSSICSKYLESSIVPYSLCCEIINTEYPCEEYYMQMLMDVYSMYKVGDDFLEVLQTVIDNDYYLDYQKKAHEIIKEHIKDNYIVAYRGEYAVEEQGNLDYKQSVSYSLDYEQAKFFATRFKMLSLTKSIVYT